jgi:antitoxin ParD1/3/4
MATVTISLPEQMKDWVEAQGESGRFSDASDYVRDLIRRDQERQGRLAEARQSREERPVTPVKSRSLDEAWVRALHRARPVGTGVR